MNTRCSSKTRFTSVFFILLILAAFVVSAVAQSRLTVGNSFVVGSVDKHTGLTAVLLSPGRMGVDGQLTFVDKSFFSCLIDGKIFTNNGIVANPATAGAKFQLDNASEVKKLDTIITTWTRDGVDIIQEVFPVSLESSGQIAMRWSFVNHKNSATTVSCQFLLDLSIFDPEVKTSNDAPTLLHKWSYSNATQHYSGDSVPPTYQGYLRNLPTSHPGISCKGYLDEPSIPTIKPAAITIGDWTKLAFSAYGVPSPSAIGQIVNKDNAILIEFSEATIAPNEKKIVGSTVYGKAQNLLSSVGTDNNNGLTVSAFPNPFTDNLSIRIMNSTSSPVITLTDILGKQIYLPSYDNMTINATALGLHSGAYFLTVSDGVSLITRSVIKQ